VDGDAILLEGSDGASRVGFVGFVVVIEGVGATVGVGKLMMGGCSLELPLFPPPSARLGLISLLF